MRRGTRRAPSLRVDVGGALDVVGTVLAWVGPAFAIPAVVALTERESPWPFVISGVVTTLAGLLLDRLTHDRDEDRIGPREGFLIVALIWLLVPVFGALPYLLGDVDQLHRPLDAYFESVSGFTATGATVLRDVEAVPEAMLFWRQLTHWLGGMGIIILAVAVLPRLRVGGRLLLQAELAGPAEIERLSATIRQTARRLWTLYVGLTVVATALLLLLGVTGLDGGLDLFDAFSYASSAVALGGFTPRDGSASTLAPVTQWALCGIMLVAGINFLRLFRVLVQRKIAAVSHDEELRLYLAFIVCAAGLLMVELFASGGAGDGVSTVRAATFQALSTMTTTGMAIADYTQWSALAVLTILFLMFIGSSAGSTGGSIKVVRHLLLFRVIRRELLTAAHPDAVVPVSVNGIVVDERSLRSAIGFVLLYVATFAVGALILAIDAQRIGSGMTPFEAIGASASCLGNVGAAFGAAGPFGSYAGFSDLSTTVLTVQMWLGRVEIIPVVVLLTRTFWRG